MAWIEDTDKELHCRQCGQFFNSEELIDSNCPNCETDEDLFQNIDNDN